MFAASGSITGWVSQVLAQSVARRRQRRRHDDHDHRRAAAVAPVGARRGDRGRRRRTARRSGPGFGGGGGKGGGRRRARPGRHAARRRRGSTTRAAARTPATRRTRCTRGGGGRATRIEVPESYVLAAIKCARSCRSRVRPRRDSAPRARRTARHAAHPAPPPRSRHTLGLRHNFKGRPPTTGSSSPTPPSRTLQRGRRFGDGLLARVASIRMRRADAVGWQHAAVLLAGGRKYDRHAVEYGYSTIAGRGERRINRRPSPPSLPNPPMTTSSNSPLTKSIRIPDGARPLHERL